MAHNMDKDEAEKTTSEEQVVTKYRKAGEIANKALQEVILKCVDGASVKALCEIGNGVVTAETDKIFKKEKNLKKGVAFPTCIGVNHCVCHFSPLESEADVILAEGDVVKIDLGAHIDGFIGVVAHTLVVGASADKKVSGRQADVLLAAYNAAEAAVRLVKAGNSNINVTENVNKVADAFGCKPVEGMLSHQLRQHVIDGENTIIQNPTEAQAKEQEKHEFEVHEVYGVDVLISTGEGKTREVDTRTTVFKRKDMVYNLKMKASRQFLSEVEKKFEYMPFTLRAFEDEKKARMGVVECQKHGLLDPFPVLYERNKEYVAQFKYTVLILPSGTQRITGGTFDPQIYESEHSIQDPELKKLLHTSMRSKAAKKKAKKSTAKAVGEITEACKENVPVATGDAAAAAN